MVRVEADSPPTRSVVGTSCLGLLSLDQMLKDISGTPGDFAFRIQIVMAVHSEGDITCEHKVIYFYLLIISIFKLTVAEVSRAVFRYIYYIT